MNIKGLSINFLGDIITEGCGTTCAENTFVELLARKCDLSAARNYGIGGTRFARQNSASPNPITDRDFCQRVNEMDPMADVVIVFGGTNDFGHGDAPLGTFQDRTADSFFGACHVLFQSLLKRYPQAKIVVLTPLHRINETNPLGDGSKTTPCPPLSVYVQAIRQTAQFYDLPLLDLFEQRILDPNNPEVLNRYVPDGLHPNDDGHLILADAICEFLENL